MKTHELKTHPEPFRSVIDGLKTAEFRLNDRTFQLDDVMILREYAPSTKTYTGMMSQPLVITHIQRGYGVPDGFVMISFSTNKF